METIEFDTDEELLVYQTRKVISQETHNKIIPRLAEKLCKTIESLTAKLATAVKALERSAKICYRCGGKNDDCPYCAHIQEALAEIRKVE